MRLRWILAKWAGQDRPAARADGVRLREGASRSVWPLKRPFVPHAVTFRRLMKPPEVLPELEAIPQRFLRSAPEAGTSTHVTIDGQKLRGVVAPEDDEPGTDLVAAFLPEER